ncbi:MAG: hypothetical protein R3E67_08505 [Pseudomonadales bacterium]
MERQRKPGHANPKKPIKMAGGVGCVRESNSYAQIGATKYGDVTKDYFGAAGDLDINSDGKADIIIGIQVLICLCW